MALEVSFELIQRKRDPTTNIATFIEIVTINGVSDNPRFQNQGVSSKYESEGGHLLLQYPCDPDANRRTNNKAPVQN